MKAKVDVAIACGAMQHSKWWGNLLGVLLQEQQRDVEIGQILAVSSALPDFNKSNIIGGGILPAMVDTSEGCAPLAAVSRAESIRKFIVLPLEFTEASGHLTPKMSIKRHVIVEDFAAEIDGIYDSNPDTKGLRIND